MIQVLRLDRTQGNDGDGSRLGAGGAWVHGRGLHRLAYSLAYRLALQGAEMARAQCGTIPLKLRKIGAVVIRNTRRARSRFSAAGPNKTLFHTVAARLEPG